MNEKILDFLVCPITKGALIYDPDRQELISLAARLAYPIKDDIPIMIEAEARQISADEYERYSKRK